MRSRPVVRPVVKSVVSTDAAWGVKTIGPKSPSDKPAPSYAAVAASSLTMDDLTPTEQKAAMSGADPDGLNCIGWLNTRHHQALEKQGVLAPSLKEQIDAYTEVVVHTKKAQPA